MKKMKFSESFIAQRVAVYFGYRQNVCVRNVSWGMQLHECDLLIMSKANYLTEVEIKISKSDLKRDLLKHHCHQSNKIKKLYFAVPKSLSGMAGWIPDEAGLITVDESGMVWTVRPAESRRDVKPITPEEAFNLARLGAMRQWCKAG
jgi:hypothetical protein